MLKLFQSIRTPIFIAMVLVFSFILGWHLSFGKEDDNPKDLIGRQESFAVALRDYYIGKGDYKTALNLHRQLLGDLNN